MRPLTTIALAIGLGLAGAACKKDKSATPSDEATTTPAAPADGTKTAADHTGHRHEPTDPYYCPMDPEETSDKPGIKCPVCQMEMVPRKK